MASDEYGMIPDGTAILASAVQYMIASGDNGYAMALIPCTLAFYRSRDFPHEGNVDGVLRGPHASHLFFQTVYSEQGESADDGRYRYLRDTVEALLPHNVHLQMFMIRLEVITPDPDWREQAERVASGRTIVNQAPDLPNGQILIWNNLRFRSEPERRIAAALDASRVLFFPNCMARLSDGERRVNREPDFLACEGGKWGIMEIDGTAYHASAARDHERDRLFRTYGIRVVERFTATECLSNAPGVVRRFLEVLQRNG